MTEFHAEIRERVQQALESLAHLAAEHGLHVPELAEYAPDERAAS